jgi:hypothetical protein
MTYASVRGLIVFVAMAVVLVVSLVAGAGVAASVLRVFAIPFVILTVEQVMRIVRNREGLGPKNQAELFGSASFAVVLLWLGFFR